MKVSVIGTGYVGLTTGVSLAYMGHEVTCADIDERKIEGLNEGKLPIYEPGLEELLSKAQDRIRFTASCREAVMEAEVIFLAVGTPANEDGSPNLSYLFQAAEDILSCLQRKEGKTVLVNKSTVPVGTGDQLTQKFQAAGLSGKVTVASNPEFLRQSRAIHDTLYPDRIVIGGDQDAVRLLTEMYTCVTQQSFPAPEHAPRPEGYSCIPLITVDRRSAELAKYAANAFLAMKISFINEIANVCDRVGADVQQVAGIIGSDARIGGAFLQAGIGYGGSCFPKDTRALHYIADTNGYDFKLLSAVIEVNGAQKLILVEKARQALQGLEGKKIAVLGLTFKPGTDDMREAPSIPITRALLAEGAEVTAHDPVALDKARALLPHAVRLEPDLEEALRGADAALLLTEWPEYLALGAGCFRSLMSRPLLLDGRNAIREEVRAGIEYHGIGVKRLAAAGSIYVNQ